MPLANQLIVNGIIAGSIYALIAASLGKNIIKYKTQALMISAFFAGIAGSLYAHYITFIDPSSFTILESILVISMIIIGGLASVKGALIGVIILILLPLIIWVSRQTFHKKFTVVISTIILMFGLLWFIERAFDVSFMPF